MELSADPNREQYQDATGVYVRGLKNNQWRSLDIAELSRDDLGAFLHEKGHQWTIDLVALLLRHE
jgi:hypothetical protein